LTGAQKPHVVKDKHGFETLKDLRNIFEPNNANSKRQMDDSKMFDIPHQINYNKEYPGRDSHKYLYTLSVISTIILGYISWVRIF